MTYQEIVSYTGTIHLINPTPTFKGGLAHLVAGRTQTMCEMHLKPEDAKLPGNRKCKFCYEATRGTE